MAPEIRNGNYGRSIDVYACGVILFEMLTGQLPFDGETPAEMLMKHQLDTPDLGKVPSTIRPVVERALEKDPTKRYQGVMESPARWKRSLAGRDRNAARDSAPAAQRQAPDLTIRLWMNGANRRLRFRSPGRLRARVGPAPFAND